jgi:hypothetical protein
MGNLLELSTFPASKSMITIRTRCHAFPNLDNGRIPNREGKVIEEMTIHCTSALLHKRAFLSLRKQPDFVPRAKSSILEI